MRLSIRAQHLKPAATLAIGAEAKARKARGEDILSFSAGEPDFDTPEFIKQAAIDALHRGQTKYTATAGIPELREAIAAHVQRERGLTYDASQVLVSCGAKQSLFNLCEALLDPGDEAIVPAPYWLSYPEMVQLAGATPKIVRCAPDNGYALSRDALEAAASPRTRLLFLNSPNNPTGAVLGDDSLQAVVGFLDAHPDVLLASDDIYERLTYGGAVFRSVLHLAPRLQERVLLVNGFSKTFSMTGWRLGYALGPKDVIGAMQRVQDQSTSNPTSFAQYGALAAMTAPKAQVDAIIEAMRGSFDERRKRIVTLLREIPGLSLAVPQGAFYVLPSIEQLLGKKLAGEPIQSGEHFCKLLLARGLAAIPGEPFGAPNHVRFSFVLPMGDLERGMQRLAQVVSELS